MRIGNRSLTSLQPRLVGTGGRLLKHARCSRCYRLPLAESRLTRPLFGSMVRGRVSVPREGIGRRGMSEIDGNETLLSYPVSGEARVGPFPGPPKPPGMGRTKETAPTESVECAIGGGWNGKTEIPPRIFSHAAYSRDFPEQDRECQEGRRRPGALETFWMASCPELNRHASIVENYNKLWETATVPCFSGV